MIKCDKHPVNPGDDSNYTSSTTIFMTILVLVYSRVLMKIMKITIIIVATCAEDGLSMKRHVAKRLCKINHIRPQLYHILIQI